VVIAKVLSLIWKKLESWLPAVLLPVISWISSGSKYKKRLCLANAFLFPYTTGLGPVLSLEEMILSGVTKFIVKNKIPQSGHQIKVTVKNFSFEGVSV